ncbi:peptide transporter 2 [Artemisia annua]|uniref:Peptide transporter 2 n=1 Tax=Artemisia annua TaxID=35608 RepID=A0A2U1N058_ARTAN|nr:peptide transporter 2 [Artemisia annua]
MGILEDDTLLLESPLIQSNISLYTRDGSVDKNGQPVLKSNTGCWKACPFILGTECCEQLAFYGISTNLVSYLTKKLHQGNASAARNVTTWQGTYFLTPLIGALLADAYWGRYWTIAVFSFIYFIGLCTMTLSATIPWMKPVVCGDAICPSATTSQYAFFFTGLYLIALGTGGIKPCVSAFGADQFDDTDPKERVKKGSFFNWFYFSISIGGLVSVTYIVWIQENKGWGLGLAIPAISMGVAHFSFFLGTPFYRFQKPGGSPITRMCQVLVASFRKRNMPLPIDSSLLFEATDKVSAIGRSRKIVHTNELKSPDKAIRRWGACLEGRRNQETESYVKVSAEGGREVDRARQIARVLLGVTPDECGARRSAMFVEQGMAMDTRVGSFTIPAASLVSFEVISVIFWVPVYDKVIVPIARRFTGEAKGFSDLQRMGVGLFLSIFCMSAAALVEIKRLDVAKSLNLDNQNVSVLMNIFWQAPQYIFLGAAEVFFFIGQIEFFYDQSPDGMRSLGSALALLTTGLGNYTSSFILTVVMFITARDGKPGWIPNNLNEVIVSFVKVFSDHVKVFSDQVPLIIEFSDNGARTRTHAPMNVKRLLRRRSSTLCQLSDLNSTPPISSDKQKKDGSSKSSQKDDQSVESPGSPRNQKITTRWDPSEACKPDVEDALIFYPTAENREPMKKKIGENVEKRLESLEQEEQIETPMLLLIVMINSGFGLDQASHLRSFKILLKISRNIILG